MNNLMQNIKTMSSREIADSTNKEHSHVIRDIKLMLSQIDDPNMDDVDFKEIFDNRGYTSEIRLNKDLTFTLIAGYSSKVRYRIVKRWQELEQQVSASQPVIALPQDYLSALKALVNSEEEKQVAQAQVIELKPKAEALARISQSAGATNIRDTAKAVGMRQNDFVAWCVDDTKPVSRRFMYRDDRGVLNAYSHRTSAGLMTQKLQSFVGHDGRDRAEPRVKFTPAGVAKIAEMLEKERNREAELV